MNTSPIIVINLLLLQSFVLQSYSFTLSSLNLQNNVPSSIRSITSSCSGSNSITRSRRSRSSCCFCCRSTICFEPKGIRISGTTSRMPTHLFQSTETKDEETTEGSSGDSMSDLDARVLQSLLEDKSLDLKSEENLVKMLENNQKNKERDRKGTVGGGGSGGKDGDSQFSSTFFKAVSDNALWNNIRKQTDNIVESTKIYIQNRIERDAKILASISVFAWEKVVKDVSRALPSSSSSSSSNNVAEAVKKTILALSSNSSYMEKTYPFLLPSELENTNVTRSIRDELSTPKDDLRQVSESIRGILSGKPMNSLTTNNNNNNVINTNDQRGLRSIAPAGTARNAERQRLAFQRRKETVLKREKEGIDKKALRVASSVTDTAWEIKREMEIEGNEAGYRSEATMKRLKASIASSALLEGGKNWIGKRLSESKSISNNPPQLESSSSSVASGGVDQDTMTVNRSLEGGTLNASPRNNLVVDKSQEENVAFSDAVLIEPEFAEPTIVEPTAVEPQMMNSQTVVEPSVVQSQVVEPNVANVRNEVEIDMNMDIGDVTESELNTERLRLIAVLQSCLEQPEQTWLRPELLSNDEVGNVYEQKHEQENESYFFSQRPSTINQKATNEPFLPSPNDFIEEEDPWEKVITELVTAKSELEVASELNGIGTMSKEEIVIELYNMQQTVDAITISVQAAAGQASANYLRTELLGESQKDVNSFESSVSAEPFSIDLDDTIVQEVETVDTPLTSESFREVSDPSETVVIADVIESDKSSPATTAMPKSPETVPADVEFRVSKFDEVQRDTSDSQLNDDYVLAADVELVTDDVEVETVKESNTMNSAAVNEEESNESEQKDNVILTLTLRTLDVLFFVTEKTITVGIPGILNTVQTIDKKTEQVNSKGLGKEGWDLLENVNDGTNRY